MTAATWLCSKWPSEAFGTRAVLRCFVGADGEEDVLDADDADIVEACARHLAARRCRCPTPEHASGRPLAGVDAAVRGRPPRARRAASATRLPPGIVVTGQPYDGVGVPDCVRAAGEAAAPVAATCTTDRSRGDGSDDRQPTDLRAVPRLHGHARAAASRSPTPTIVRAPRRRSRTSTSRGTARVAVRGTYSTVGFRADADLMLWLVGRLARRRAARVRGVPPHRGRPSARPCRGRSWGS